MIRMIQRNASTEEIEEQKKLQKLRIKITKAARRSGKIRKRKEKSDRQKLKQKLLDQGKKLPLLKNHVTKYFFLVPKIFFLQLIELQFQDLVQRKQDKEH